MRLAALRLAAFGAILRLLRFRLAAFCVWGLCVCLRLGPGLRLLRLALLRLGLASTILRLARSCVCVWLRLRLAAFAFAAFEASCVWQHLDSSAQPWPDDLLAGW